MSIELQEKTRAAAAPRKPKNGAVSSPLKALIVGCGSEATLNRSEDFNFQRELPFPSFDPPLSV